MFDTNTLTDIGYSRSNPIVAPELSDADPIGDQVTRLRDFRGRVVLLTFWTVNDLPCRHLLYTLNRVHMAYEAEGLQIIGIHSPKTSEERKLHRVLSVVQEMDIEFPM